LCGLWPMNLCFFTNANLHCNVQLSNKLYSIPTITILKVMPLSTLFPKKPKRFKVRSNLIQFPRGVWPMKINSKTTKITSINSQIASQLHLLQQLQFFLCVKTKKYLV
jgi:hypothetical protein